MFFSAFGSELSLDQHVIPFAAPGDPFATGQSQPMLNVRNKTDLNRCIDELCEIEVSANAVDEITLEGDIDLTDTEARLIRLVVRRSGGETAQVKTFGSGLSSAKTFQVTASAADGSPRLLAAVKVDSLPELEREGAGFSRRRRRLAR